MTTATSTADAVELLPGYYLDPDGSGALCSLPWPGYRALPYGHPDRLRLLPPSLGPSIIRWGEATLLHHLTGLPWRYTAGQRRFLHLWYAFDPDTGRWLYRRGVKRGAKGTGKDPFAAAWALTELCGPVRLVDFDGRQARGVPHRFALVQIAANSEAQAKDVLRVAGAMIGADFRADYGLDVAASRIITATGSRAELLTASEGSSEGDPATAVALNESHHMTESNGGSAIAAVAQRNVGKSPKELQARLIAFTNAHRNGAGSRAEVDYDAWQQQVSGRTRTKKVDILYDTREASPSVNMADEDSLRAGIVAAYSDAPWADIDRLCDEANDPATPVADLIRYYLNGLGAAADAWVDPGNFDALGRGLEVATGEQIAMFLDCSKSGDATGLVGCRLDDGHVITLDVWQRPHGWSTKAPWLVPVAEVDAAVRAAFDRFTVMWFGVDPSPAEDDTGVSYWMPAVDAWHRDFADVLPNWATPGSKSGTKAGHSVLFDMRRSQPGAVDRLRAFTATAMQTATDIDGPDDETEQARALRLAAPALTHDGDPTLRTHVHNARRRPNSFGMSLGKETRDSSKLVDLAVCMVGARLGRRIALNSGNKPKRKRTGRVW
jgi:hypothetical protein